MAQTHALSVRLDNRPFRILVVGAGGSGSSIFLALPYLHQAMVAWGHSGLDVTLMDADTVSATNCIRQNFAVSDIGQNKAITLTNRVNLFWNVSWTALPKRFSARTDVGELDLIIGCVDSAASRKLINDVVTRKGATVAYWLDLGNKADHGQYVLGQPLNKATAKTRNRLPTAAELHPEIIDTTIPEDTLPSCSAVEALEKQEPFINQTLAMHAMAMLTRLLRYGKTSYHGAFYNSGTGTVQPILVPKPIRNR